MSAEALEEPYLLDPVSLEPIPIYDPRRRYTRRQRQRYSYDPRRRRRGARRSYFYDPQRYGFRRRVRRVRRAFGGMNLWKGLGGLAGIVAAFASVTAGDRASFGPTPDASVSAKFKFILADFLHRLTFGGLSLKFPGVFAVGPGGVTGAPGKLIIPGLSISKAFNNWTWAGLAGIGYWALKHWLHLPLPYTTQVVSIAAPVFVGGLFGAFDPAPTTAPAPKTPYTRPPTTALPQSAVSTPGAITAQVIVVTGAGQQYTTGSAGLSP